MGQIKYSANSLDVLGQSQIYSPEGVEAVEIKTYLLRELFVPTYLPTSCAKRAAGDGSNGTSQAHPSNHHRQRFQSPRHLRLENA
jgi:hypothetical protein